MTEIKIIHNPFKIVEMFEEEVCGYTGAPWAIAVDSCTNALFLALMYHKKEYPGRTEINIPKRTYLSVAQTILNAGYDLSFRDKGWKGMYNLEPTSIYDCAKRFTSDMYVPSTVMCLSFHIKKSLPLGKGGMILTDNRWLASWCRMARYEGRSEVNYRDDNIDQEGWNMYMEPETAARGLTLMQNYPGRVKDQIENPPYRDLTEFKRFKDCRITR